MEKITRHTAMTTENTDQSRETFRVGTGSGSVYVRQNHDGAHTDERNQCAEVLAERCDQYAHFVRVFAQSLLDEQRRSEVPKGK